MAPGQAYPSGPAQQPLPGFTPAPASPGNLPGRVREVVIEDNHFSPNVIAVPAGTLVVWRNKDHHPHTVTFPRQSVDSGLVAPGGQFSAYAGHPGSHEYYCRIHGQQMDGVVIVY